MEAVGLAILAGALGKPLTNARRFVLDLGNANDAFGHGITEFAFGDSTVVVRPGPNEDYILVEDGPFNPDVLCRDDWSEVNISALPHWSPRGTLDHVDVFAYDLDDVALVFVFGSGDMFSVVLCDTDLAIGRHLERFNTDVNHVQPACRATIGGAQ